MGDSESFLEVTDCRLRFIAGVVYVTEDVMTLTGLGFRGFVREVNYMGCGFFCGAGLVDVSEQ